MQTRAAGNGTHCDTNKKKLPKDVQPPYEGRDSQKYHRSGWTNPE